MKETYQEEKRNSFHNHMVFLHFGDTSKVCQKMTTESKFPINMINQVHNMFYMDHFCQEIVMMVWNVGLSIMLVYSHYKFGKYFFCHNDGVKGMPM